MRFTGLRGLSRKCLRRSRRFQTNAEYAQWQQQVLACRMLLPAAAATAAADRAPLLLSVDPMAEHLRLKAVPAGHAPVGTSAASMIECVYPLAHDDKLRVSVSDLGFTKRSDGLGDFFRLSKFYEAVDALTGDVAYHHADGVANGLTFVTAGHYHSRKLRRTDISRDLMLRCYMTAAGSSSVEVRTDAVQLDTAGKEQLVNVCHTTMVALDKSTMQPVPGAVPALLLDDETACERAELAALHKRLRKQRSAATMQLRHALSVPPTAEEMIALHELHRTSKTASQQTVCQHTHTSSYVVFPEQRNVHGKLFGGFVVGQATNLALFAAKTFAQGSSVVPVGIDEAVFEQPVAVGDLVKFTCRVVHSTKHTCRVLCHVIVMDPQKPKIELQRSNRLMFVFAMDQTQTILPESYAEALMHVDAARRSAVEGPTEAEATRILEQVLGRDSSP